MEFEKISEKVHRTTCPAGDEYELREGRNGNITVYMNGEDISVCVDLEAAKARVEDHATKMPGTRERRALIAENKKKAKLKELGLSDEE